MNDPSANGLLTVSIAAVERDTGLSKDTLRVWERRYGFPAPVRDSHGERAYPTLQIEKLRVIKRLLDNGHRPGRVVAMNIKDLQSLGEKLATTPQRFAAADTSPLDTYLDAIKSHDAEGLRRRLGQAMLQMGVANFVTEVVAPLTVWVGDAWMRGQLEIFEEHVYTESVVGILRNAINTAGAAHVQPSPRIVLTTFPHEPHGLGILMAEAMMALEGCRCVSLGTQTPIFDIVLAAKAHRADIVALSFTASQNPNDVIHGLKELRAKLPARTAVWVGGTCSVLHRKRIDGVTALADLQAIGETVRCWRMAARDPLSSPDITRS